MEEVQRRQDALGYRVDMRSVMEVLISYQLCCFFCDVYDLDNLRQRVLNRRKRENPASCQLCFALFPYTGYGRLQAKLDIGRDKYCATTHLVPLIPPLANLYLAVATSS